MSLEHLQVESIPNDSLRTNIDHNHLNYKLLLILAVLPHEPIGFLICPNLDW